MADICFGCGAELTYIDRDPNGEKNATCAKCRAEESHDFDAEPGAVFARDGSRAPTPRLVPDRPSASDKLRSLAAVIRTYGTCAPSALEYVADEIDAAAPPAEAPAERGEWVLAQKPADAVREALERIESECGNRGDSAYNEMDVDAIREFILDLTNEADRLAALAGAGPVAYSQIVPSTQPGIDFEHYLYALPPGFAVPEGATPLYTHPHAPAKAREDVLLPLLRDMWAETVSHAEMWGQRPDDALRDRYLAALATFAEGES